MAQTEKIPHDPDRIDVSDERECRYWSEKLGVSPDVLSAAVAEVGPLLEDVQRELIEKSAAGVGSRG